MNENAISNILLDVDFLEDELKRISRGHLVAVFAELRAVSIFPRTFCRSHSPFQTCGIALNNTVQEYLVPANRRAAYSMVKHKRLQALLEKLARYGAQQRANPERELGERRRKEAEAVGRLFPGEV